MALDEKLNDRIRAVLKSKKGISEKNMFGGLCFLHNGNMLCGADLKHGLSVRVGSQNYEKYLKLKYTKKMDFTGKELKGLIFVKKEGCKSKATLARWIERGLEFTKTLPKKSQ